VLSCRLLGVTSDTLVMYLCLLQAIPYQHFLTNPKCILATTPTGGHLGWVAGRGAPLGAPWSDDVAVEFLTAVLEEGQASAADGSRPESTMAKVRQYPVPVRRDDVSFGVWQRYCMCSERAAADMVVTSTIIAPAR
jgi:hypothetical protein